jgi:glutamine synthetase
VLAQIDLSTYRRIPWEHNVPFFLVSFLDPDTHEPVCACPRGMLKKALGQADEKGWEGVAGVEYEVSFGESAWTVRELTISFWLVLQF